MNQSGDDQAECPLCMEPYEVDDLNFFPCTCGYQICRFCWHRIRTDENGLCPACRKAYPENPADFKPLSQEQVAKLKAEKRQKEQQRKQKATESRKHLSNVRVVQKNLVFVVGLPIRLAEPNVLKKHEYFGKFGKIHKVVINQSTSYAGATGPSASAYVTYNRCEDALRAIQAVNNICVDNRILKTSLGTTKYCSHFIKTQTCPKPDCMYLHDLGDPEASFTKEEMQQGKHQEYEKKLHEQLNNSMSQERKTTPSPPALGNNVSNSNCGTSFPSVNKEAWPSLQNGTTQASTGGGTTSAPVNSVSEITSTTTATVTTTTTTTSSSVPSSVSATNGKQQQQPPQQQQVQPHQITKSKQNKEKNNSANDKTNNKKKGKEKHINSINSNNNNNNNNNNTTTTNNNIHVAEKHEKSGKSNKEKEKQRVSGEGSQADGTLNNNQRILQTNNNKSSLFGNENNSLFSNNNFSKKMITGSKDSSPPSNGFIKGLESVAVNCDTGFGTGKNHNDKDTNESDSKTITNADNERVKNATEEADKTLTNGLITESVNSPFDKLNYTQKDSFNYQNGSLPYSNNSNCQQNLFINYISLNKFEGPVKNESILGDSNEVIVNQANQLLGQQNFLLKQHLSQQQHQQQQQQQRNQPTLQQIILQQHQQNVFQQPQNQYSQDFRLVQQQQAPQPQQQQPPPPHSHQPLNGMHAQAQHFNYIQQHPTLRDQFLLQQKQNQLLINNYNQNGNNFIHMPNREDLVVVDNLMPQPKYIENGLNHSNMYTCDFKLKENCKSDENNIDKDSVDVHNRIIDDELGFDPFHETQKALADLMEKELLIQQNKQVLQHKNEQYYQQSLQSYGNQHGFDNCPRGFSHLQMNTLNQHNNHMLGGKLLAQIHSQQLLNSSSPKSSGNNRLDGIRCTLPPPGFATPSQSGPPGHLGSFGPGAPRSSSSSKILPFVSLSNGESSYQSHYVPNGVSKSDEWPESLRSLVQDSSTPPPASGSSFTPAKVWNNIGNCSDWTALDPAIVSSSIPQHLALHTQSLINHQGLSQIHQSQLQNQMSQLNIGSILAHNNWSHRQNDDNWSSHIQSTAVPPPGFTLRHTEADMKKPVISGIEGLE